MINYATQYTQFAIAIEEIVCDFRRAEIGNVCFPIVAIDARARARAHQTAAHIIFNCYYKTSSANGTVQLANVWA